MRFALAVLFVGVTGLACSVSAPLMAEFEARHPQLERFAGHRLTDLRPYYLPLNGHLILFICRWPDGHRIPVSLPADASATDRRYLETALVAWEGAGLGISFERRWGEKLDGWGIEIVLRDDMIAYSTNTVTDCAVDLTQPVAPSVRRLEARIALASIHAARGDLRLAGSVIHELGHALGFQGHARRGSTAMLRDTNAIRRSGERALAGRTHSDATLQALYAVPSGSVVRNIPLSDTHVVDRLVALGRERGWIGPLLRVGDHEGRMQWYERNGTEIVVLLTPSAVIEVGAAVIVEVAGEAAPSSAPTV